MGVLMRSQGVVAELGDDTVMLFFADHWTPDDMAAFDNMGADAYMAWVDRGYAGG